MEKSRNVVIEALYRCLNRHFVFAWRNRIGFDGEGGIRELTIRKMFFIAFGKPFPSVLETIWHLWYQIEGHDKPVEVVEIIRCEQRLLIDVGSSYARAQIRQAWIVRRCTRLTGKLGCARHCQMLSQLL